MILKTLEKFIGYESDNVLKRKYINPILKFFYKNQCIKHYSKEYTESMMVEALTDMVYACMMIGAKGHKSKDDSLSMIYTVYDPYQEYISIDITYRNNIKLNIRVRSRNELNYTFTDNNIKYEGDWSPEHYLFGCNEFVRAEINAVVVYTLVTVLNFILGVTPKYMYNVNKKLTKKGDKK